MNGKHSDEQLDRSYLLNNNNDFSCKECSFKQNGCGSLRIASWNVNSWTITNSEIRKAILNYVKPDIIIICETKLKDKECIKLEGYKWNGFNRRKQLKTAKCGSGGVGIFIRNSLLSEWKLTDIDHTIDGLYITSLASLKNECKNNACCLLPST